MLSAMLFSIATVALCQFALYYWRAVLTGVASQPISSRILEAANVEEQLLSGDHFRKLADLYALTPELRGKGGGLGFVGVYYHLLERLGQASFLAVASPHALRVSFGAAGLGQPYESKRLDCTPCCGGICGLPGTARPESP